MCKYQNNYGLHYSYIWKTLRAKYLYFWRKSESFPLIHYNATCSPTICYYLNFNIGLHLSRSMQWSMKTMPLLSECKQQNICISCVYFLCNFHYNDFSNILQPHITKGTLCSLFCLQWYEFLQQKRKSCSSLVKC